MKIFPEEAVEDARIGRELERGNIEFHRKIGDISEFVLDVMCVKNIVCYPPAVALNSLSAYVNKIKNKI